MDELNDIEKGQLVGSAYESFSDAGGGLKDLPGLLKKIIRTKAWECRKHPCGRTVYCNSLADLITMPPLEGWGESIESIESLIKHDAEALTMFRQAITKPVGSPEGGNNKYGRSGKPASEPSQVNESKSKQGNSKSYTLDRLSREAPELFAKVVAGDLSANKAAIEAGFRKKTITVPVSVKGVSNSILSNFSADEVKAIVRELQRQQVDNINSVSGGTSAEYTARRLKRDNPELLDKVKARYSGNQLWSLNS